MKKTVLFAAGIFVYAVCFVGKLQIPSSANSIRDLSAKLSSEATNAAKHCFPERNSKSSDLFPNTAENNPELLMTEPKYNN